MSLNALGFKVKKFLLAFKISPESFSCDKALLVVKKTFIFLIQ